ncbi:MAG TPA: Crp/Fnr family transcriptional regulator [Pseudogracilibacillus sp.]|nr:Crp/Fnr family transcriptional regulator [Pseudogracilibacillus sp.]
MQHESCSHTPSGSNRHPGAGCVSRVPIFNHLEEEQLQEVMKTVRHRSLAKHEYLYSAGDTSNSLYVVNRGKIKIFRLSESGKEQLLRILQHGDFTGELALFQQAEHEAYAEALTETEVCVIHRDDFQQLLMKYPTISLKVLTEFANRLDYVEKQTTLFATEKVETRIAHYLLACLEEQQRDDGVIDLPMSKKDLASHIGTTPETVSRRLREFEEADLIRQEGRRRIIILREEDLLHV